MDQAFPGFHDPEESLEFSVGPELPDDSLADVIKDAVADYVTPANRQACFRSIHAALENRDPNKDSHADQHDIIWRMCDLFRRSDNGKLLANCLLLLISRQEKSEVQIARELGVTKAAVSAVHSNLRDILGFRGRCGRSDAARERFSIECTQRHKAKPQPKWTGLQEWSKAFHATRLN